MKVTHLTPLLNVADVDRTCQFYDNAFGFKVAAQAGPSGGMFWARIVADGLAVTVNKHGEGSERRIAERSDHRDIVLYVAVDDAAALHARLVQLG